MRTRELIRVGHHQQKSLATFGNAIVPETSSVPPLGLATSLSVKQLVEPRPAIRPPHVSRSATAATTVKFKNPSELLGF
jgi:hypothetical protein